MAYEYEDYSRKQDAESQNKKDLLLSSKAAFLAKNHLHYDSSEHQMNDLVLRELLKHRKSDSDIEFIVETGLLLLFVGMIVGANTTDVQWWVWLIGFIVCAVGLCLFGDHLSLKNNLLTLAGFKVKKELNKANLFSFLKIALNNSAIKGLTDKEREKLFTKFVEAMFDEENGSMQLLHASNDIAGELIRGYNRIDKQEKDDKHSIELNSFVAGLSQEELDSQFKSQLLYNTLKSIKDKNK